MTFDRLDFLAEYGHDEHLNYLIKHNAAMRKVAARDDLTQEQVDKIANHPDKHVREIIAMHPNISHEHMTKFMSDTDHIRANLATNKNLSDEHLDKLRDDDWWNVRYHADSNYERRRREKWNQKK